MPVGGAPVTPVDKNGNVIGGSSTSPEYVRAVNTQTRQAETTALPAFYILAKDAADADALIGVYSVPPVLPAGTPRTGVTISGVKNVAAANTSRRGLTMQNTSDTEMRVTEDDTDPTATVGYQVAPGGKFTASTNKSIRVYCATAGKGYAATEW